VRKVWEALMIVIFGRAAYSHDGRSPPNWRGKLCWMKPSCRSGDEGVHPKNSHRFPRNPRRISHCPLAK